MCKYYYRGGLCANNSVMSPLCMGESSCPVDDDGKMKEFLKPNTMVVDSEDAEQVYFCPQHKTELEPVVRKVIKKTIEIKTDENGNVSKKELM